MTGRTHEWGVEHAANGNAEPICSPHSRSAVLDRPAGTALLRAATVSGVARRRAEEGAALREGHREEHGLGAAQAVADVAKRELPEDGTDERGGLDARAHVPVVPRAVRDTLRVEVAVFLSGLVTVFCNDFDVHLFQALTRKTLFGPVSLRRWCNL